MVKKTLLTTPIQDLSDGFSDGVFSEECFAHEMPVVKEAFRTLKMQVEVPSDPSLHPKFASLTSIMGNMRRNALQTFLNELFETRLWGFELGRQYCNGRHSCNLDCNGSQMRHPKCPHSPKQTGAREWIVADYMNRQAAVHTVIYGVYAALGPAGLDLLASDLEKHTGKVVESRESIMPEVFCGQT